MSKQILDILKNKGILEKSHKQEQAPSQIKGFEYKDNFFYKEEYIPFTKEEQNFIQDKIIYIPFLDENLSIYDFVFFDLETTGLSSSGGCLAFLAGIGKITDRGFLFKQFFLPSFSAEPTMLENLFTELHKKIIVSYNGKSYDIPLIKNRMIYNKHLFNQNALSFNSISQKTNDFIKKHIDLLHIARSLFKNILPGCSLKQVENSLLDLYRTDDVEGFEIPNIFFDFIKSKEDNDLLQKVFFHNKLDITSLFKILIKFVNIFTNREYKDINKDSISRYLIKREKIDLATEILKKGVKNKERASIKTLSLLHKKNLNLEEAVQLWYDYIDTATEFEPFAYEELAKYYEHKVKDFNLALQIVQDALQQLEVMRSLDKFIDINIYEAFIKRKNRLRRKMLRNNISLF